MKSLVVFFALMFLSHLFIAQTCQCTVDQVQANTVESCDLIVGQVDTVSTVSELWAAINMANSSGGERTILIADGSYEMASTASFPYITADHVVFRSLSGDRDAVVIHGQGMRATSSTEDGFLIAGDHVTIADLTIRDVGNHGIQVSGHHLYVHNVRIQDTYEQMIKGSTTGSTIDSAIIQCSLFEYTAGIGPNWYIGGLDIHKGNAWLVRDNVFLDISSPVSSVAEHAVHFWNNSMHNVVERNMIYNCDRGIGFGLGNNGNQNNGGIIRNNMIYNDGSGLFDDVGIGLETSPNTKVYNNTVYIEYQNAIEYRFAETTNAQIFNNLTNKLIRSRNDGTASLGTNVTNAAEDWFVDASNGNLRLTEARSDLVDQGTRLALDVSDDIDQTPRPLGQGYDIGAQEWLVSATNNQLQETSIRISPNPCSNFVHIELPSITGNYEIAIVDVYGKLLHQTDINESRNDEIINLIDFEEGLYFLLVVQNSSIVSQSRLVVIK